MAGHEMYAVSALSAVAAMLLARWCLVGRHSSPCTAAEYRRASRRATLRAAWRMGSAAGRAGHPERAVQEAEALVHGHWRRISSPHPSQRDHPQH